MALITTREAAERIGVSVRHVQRLVASGSVAGVGIDRLDADSVEQWLAQRRAGRVRAWEEATAWGSVALLEGGSAEWLGQSRRSRLRSSLAGLTGAELATRTRNRARVQRYFAHPRALSHLASSIVQSGAMAGIGGLTSRSDRLDGYVQPNAVPRLVDRFHLEPDPTGSVTLRATGMPRDVVVELASGQRHVLAGLDLAGSLDARERSAGYGLLDRALTVLRG